MFEHVHLSGLPNYKGCRISLPTALNLSAWRSNLEQYDDRIVCEYLEFGFPIDYHGPPLTKLPPYRNHKGAREFSTFVSEYFVSECDKRRIAGPYVNSPLSIPLVISPINTVPKPDSSERRVIVDLSWPLGASVNCGILTDQYMGEMIDLHYASVESICNIVSHVGASAMIYKRDLRKAYRQIPVDPGDYYLLGYWWDNRYYFGTALAMGQRNAAMACSRTTAAVMYIHAARGCRGASYLDDLIGVSPPSSADLDYLALGQLLQELGLEEKESKACPPSTTQTVLGVLIDTVAMTISVTPERLCEIKSLI